jgi:hemolysin-activating ACP:hemolysin acyltransferase
MPCLLRQQPIDFHTADALREEIMAFMVKMGGAYREGEMEGVSHSILLALGCGQYVLMRNEEGKITAFASFWCVKEEDMPDVRAMKQPDDIYTGNIMYVSEWVAYPGMVRKVVVELQKMAGPDMQGVISHKGGRVKEYRSIRGLLCH